MTIMHNPKEKKSECETNQKYKESTSLQIAEKRDRTQGNNLSIMLKKAHKRRERLLW